MAGLSNRLLALACVTLAWLMHATRTGSGDVGAMQACQRTFVSDGVCAV